MSTANWLETGIVNYFLRQQAVTQPSAIFVGLHTADPGETGASEVTGNAYQRTAVTMGAPTDGVSVNSNVVTFPTATPSGWGSIGYFSLWDAQSSGNCLYTGALDTAKTINAGDTAQFNAGTITASQT